MWGARGRGITNKTVGHRPPEKRPGWRVNCRAVELINFKEKSDYKWLNELQ